MRVLGEDSFATALHTPEQELTWTVLPVLPEALAAYLAGHQQLV